jgi:hypothetical protein
MTVLQAIKLNIYTLRTLRSDESAGYIALVRTSDSSARDTEESRNLRAAFQLYFLTFATNRVADFLFMAQTQTPEAVHNSLLCAPGCGTLYAQLMTQLHSSFLNDLNVHLCARRLPFCGCCHRSDACT